MKAGRVFPKKVRDSFQSKPLFSIYTARDLFPGLFFCLYAGSLFLSFHYMETPIYNREVADYAPILHGIKVNLKTKKKTKEEKENV